MQMTLILKTCQSNTFSGIRFTPRPFVPFHQSKENNTNRKISVIYIGKNIDVYNSTCVEQKVFEINRFKTTVQNDKETSLMYVICFHLIRT